MELNTLTVDLFGTCGGSRWREPFIARYKQLGIPYFNPQVDDWKPELAEIEAWHLVHDQLLLFPVTGETYGTGSLTETGFSVLSTLRGNSNRFVVIHIDPDLAPELKDKNLVAAKESLRARKLVLEHLAQTKHPNVFIVDSLATMLDVSLSLFHALVMIEHARQRIDGRGQLPEEIRGWLERIGSYRGLSR